MTSNVFDTPKDEFRDSDDGYHYITTNSPRLDDLGLSAFTTGTLYDWLHVKNFGGVYRQNYEVIDSSPGLESVLKQYNNLKFWKHKYSGEELGEAVDLWPHEVLFTFVDETAYYTCNPEDKPDGSTESFCFYHGWRKKGKNGEYVKVSATTTDSPNDSMDWKYTALEGPVTSDVGPIQQEEVSYSWDDLDAEYFDTRIIKGWGRFEAITTPLTKTPSLIHRIIEMNSWVRAVKLKHPNQEEWDKKTKARNYFINDIKSSKEKYLQWHALPEFLMEIPSSIAKLIKEGGVEDGKGCKGACSKLEDVYFQLYLYDGDKPKNTARKTTTESMTIVQTPVNAVGTKYKSKDEGGITPPSVTPDPSNAVVGELNVTWVDETGEWESGSQQVVAILIKPLLAASQPDLDSFLNDDEFSLLDAEKGVGVTVGKAMILSVQNGNTLQWMPDFHYSKDCRAKEDINKNRKVIVDVVNPSKRSFKAGEDVILQRIHGVWIPMAQGEDNSSTDIAPADPKWDFTYMITNSMFFFRNHDWYLRDRPDSRRKCKLELSLSWPFFDIVCEFAHPTKTTPNQYEQSFYWWYYKQEETSTSDLPVVDIDNNKERYPYSVDSSARVLNGYMQVTSWDFMGVGIGGLRRNGSNERAVASDTELNEFKALDEGWDGVSGVNGNALSCTQFSVNQKSEPFEGGGVGEEKNSYPFFGCVFPDGYNAKEKHSELMDKNGDFYLAPKNYEVFEGYQSKTPFFYAAYGGWAFENLNNVRGTAGSAHQEFGIFPEGEDGELKHLPSDIGTNASPSGINGQPISNIGIIGELNHKVGSPYFRATVGNYFNKNDAGRTTLSWMHKKQKSLMNDDEDAVDKQIDAESTYGYDDNAFDLQPKNPLKIEFRPLLQEVYSCFEGLRYENDTLTPHYDEVEATLGRGQFAHEGYQFNKAHYSETYTNGGFTPSLSPYSLFRNPQVIKEPSVHGVGNSLQTFDAFTLYQNQNSDGQRAVNEQGFRYNKDLSSLNWGYLSSDDMVNAPNYWWNESWMETSVPGGGVGVIGAIVTIGARDQVTFKTENAVGLDDYLETGGTYPRSWRGGDYSTMNTTQLYARVYQQWPRDQMIYDPRFFVVHHFNPDASIQDKLVEQEASEEAFSLYGSVLTFDFNPALRNPLHMVDIKESDVDFVVPTYWDNTQIPVDGRHIYYDSGLSDLNNDSLTGVTKLRKKAHWRVSSQRRGKLLPYSYKFATIALATTEKLLSLNISQDFDYFLQPNGNLLFTGMNRANTVSASQDILIVNRGEGYANNSKFLTEGGEGGGVVLKATVNEAGGVIGFTVESTGYDFAPEDFMKSTDEISYEAVSAGAAPKPSFSSLKVKIVAHPDTVGTGFEGYVCRGTMVEGPVITDAKPMEALTSKGPIKITLDPASQREGDTIQTLQETRENSVTLGIDPDASTAVSAKSPFQLVNRVIYKPNEYDVFLHFHNDISHTRMNEGNRPAELEQMVRLEIFPDGSDGGASVAASQGSTTNSSSWDGDRAGNSFAAGGGLGGLLFGGGGFGGFGR